MQNLLIIAKSGRMLAQMAVDAGLTPLVIDCYGDCDTKHLAADIIQIDSLSINTVMTAVAEMGQHHTVNQLIYGSGFESMADCLELLTDDFSLLGNSAKVFRRAQDKHTFFNLLDQLAIDHPQTLFHRPTSAQLTRNWLIKPLLGEGGLGIRHYMSDGGHSIASKHYWQLHQPGESMSVLFVANGHTAKILGFNHQWQSSADQSQPFLFAGICNGADLAREHKQQLSIWIEKLTDAYRLRGLNSLDFILSDDRCHVLELNARIPASAQLYDRSMSTHLQGLTGNLPENVVQPLLPYRAYYVIYAECDLIIPSEILWPQWLVDRPSPGAFIGDGAPVCSIIAAADSAEVLQQKIRQQLNIVEHLLGIQLTCNTRQASTN